jgi:hypothetical protein
MRNLHLAVVVAGLLTLPARAAVAQDTSENMGGGYVVGPNGVASPVIGDGMGGGFVVGPSGVASPVIGDRTGGAFVVGPSGVASPVVGGMAGD